VSELPQRPAPAQRLKSSPSSSGTEASGGTRTPRRALGVRVTAAPRSPLHEARMFF